MGVKEYRFLTRTMKTITARSNKLEKGNSRLTKTENSLKDSRASARSARSEIKRKEKSRDGTFGEDMGWRNGPEWNSGNLPKDAESFMK